MTEKRFSSAEGALVLAFCTAASAAAIVWSWRHGAIINYGDAIAHLHIARRILDSRLPRFSELGSVWLPLPHILLLPFVQSYSWWASGFAGIIPSALAYLASCAGIYRLARNWLTPAPAALALIFFALNPNLLYLQTTAMTEPLFLCEMIWIVVWLVEWRGALDEETAIAGSDPAPREPRPKTLRAARLQLLIAMALVTAIFTRYDGWIIALIAWSGIALTLFRRVAEGDRARLASPTFWFATVAIVAAPILWFVYNQVCFGDWLFFARGPYSAHAIELHTAANAPGWPPHPGWHNPWVALLFYLKVSELDSIAAPGWGNLWGNIVLALAALGTVRAFFSETAPARRSLAWTFLLWIPVPFYAWSVAFGSVPIFFPAWWPYTWYNTRYGLELLPALALGVGFAAQFITSTTRRIKFQGSTALLPNLAFALLLVLAVLNALALFRSGPIVYIEGTKNALARQLYDNAIPPALQNLLSLDPHATVLMNTSLYPEIVSFTGIPLRQTINESDLGIYRSALQDPATHAAIVVTFEGDEIDAAVKAHRVDFTLIGSYSAKNQPSAAIYASSNWLHRAHDFF